MASDASKVGSAVIAKLQAYAPLTALMSDGVFRNQAPPDKTKFVIVQLQHGTFEYAQPGRIVFVDALYLVKAVVRDTSVSTAVAAAQAIFDALQDAALSIAGYVPMLVNIDEPIEYTEVDENPELRWQHFGGIYHVMASAV